MESSRAWTDSAHVRVSSNTHTGAGGRAGGRAGGAAARLIVLIIALLAWIDAAHRGHERLARLHLLPAQLLLRSSGRAGWDGKAVGVATGSWVHRELGSRACWSRSASCSEASSGESASPSAAMSGASPGVAATDLAVGPGVFSLIAW